MASWTKKTQTKRDRRDEKIARRRQKKTRVRDRKAQESGKIVVNG